LTKFEYLKRLQQSGLFYLSKHCDFTKLSVNYKHMSDYNVLTEVQKSLSTAMTFEQKAKYNKEIMEERHSLGKTTRIRIGAKIKNPEDNSDLSKRDREWINKYIKPDTIDSSLGGASDTTVSKITSSQAEESDAPPTQDSTWRNLYSKDVDKFKVPQKRDKENEADTRIIPESESEQATLEKNQRNEKELEPVLEDEMDFTESDSGSHEDSYIEEEIFVDNHLQKESIEEIKVEKEAEEKKSKKKKFLMEDSSPEPSISGAPTIILPNNESQKSKKSDETIVQNMINEIFENKNRDSLKKKLETTSPVKKVNAFGLINVIQEEADDIEEVSQKDEEEIMSKVKFFTMFQFSSTQAQSKSLHGMMLKRRAKLTWKILSCISL
jgi:hypothetical protein